MDSAAPALEDAMLELGRRAVAALARVRNAEAGARTAALEAMAEQLRASEHQILAANGEDMNRARVAGKPDSYLDRLALTPARLSAVIDGVTSIARLPDPVGAVMAEWRRPNGLHLQRVRTPLGVIGMIFESRPNVAADAGALALRAGNVILLRGGADSSESVAAIVTAMRRGLIEAGLPQDAIQTAASSDRAAVGMMLAGLDGALDVIVPRGGKSLVARVQAEARVPVFAHLEGVCHTYVHASADPGKAISITVNAKMRRTSVCGATETLLIDKLAAPSLLPQVAAALREQGCELRGDDAARAIVPMAQASEADWRTEYLAPVLAIRVVEDIDQAIEHIAAYGSQHTDCIVAEDHEAAERFLREVDSAIVLHNASTQFADGGEFGFGAEIGIATGRLHARGPIGADQLTTFKYVVRGEGQTRS